MTLRDLDAQLVFEGEDGGFTHVDTVAEANGVTLDCPRCAADGRLKRSLDGRGLHWVYIPFQNNARGHRNRWTATGTTIDDLTTNPSFLIVGACGAHFYIGRRQPGTIDLLAN